MTLKFCVSPVCSWCDPIMATYAIYSLDMLTFVTANSTFWTFPNMWCMYECGVDDCSLFLMCAFVCVLVFIAIMGFSLFLLWKLWRLWLDSSSVFWEQICFACSILFLMVSNVCRMSLSYISLKLSHSFLLDDDNGGRIMLSFISLYSFSHSDFCTRISVMSFTIITVYPNLCLWLFCILKHIFLNKP